MSKRNHRFSGCARGVHGIMTTGGNGEFPHLLPDERKKVLEIAVNSIKGKVPVIDCTTACSVKETILNTQHAEMAVADAVILVPPILLQTSS